MLMCGPSTNGAPAWVSMFSAEASPASTRNSRCSAMRRKVRRSDSDSTSTWVASTTSLPAARNSVASASQSSGFIS